MEIVMQDLSSVSTVSELFGFFWSLILVSEINTFLYKHTICSFEGYSTVSVSVYWCLEQEKQTGFNPCGWSRYTITRGQIHLSLFWENGYIKCSQLAALLKSTCQAAVSSAIVKKKFWDAKLLSYISKKKTNLELVNKKKRFKGAKEPF